MYTLWSLIISLSNFDFLGKDLSVILLSKFEFPDGCFLCIINNQKQPPRGVLKKICSENIQQIYRITLMPKYYFNKVA